MAKWVQRLSRVDTEARTAICAKCGPARIRVKKNGVYCQVAANQRKKQYCKQPHGLTGVEADKLKEGEKCYICHSTEDLTVDHCHITQELRGILCSRHNKALGLFSDNLDHLAKAYEYLRNPPGFNA